MIALRIPLTEHLTLWNSVIMRMAIEVDCWHWTTRSHKWRFWHGNNEKCLASHVL